MDLRTQLNYIMIGIGIGIFYTGVFMLITNLDDYESIIPEADAVQIASMILIGLPLGVRHSQETRLKMSLAHKGQKAWNKGKKMPQGFGEKIKQIVSGRVCNELTRKKISMKLKGNKNPLGCKRSEETKRILSEQKKGKSNHREGTHHKPETILKIKAQKGWKHSEETKEKMKKIRATIVMPLRNTKPERLFRKALEEKGIKFKQGKLIQTTPKDFYHQVDFFIEPNICVEIDGTYWHQLPNVIIRDKEVNERLKQMGYLVIRYSATDKFNQKTANNFVNNLMEVMNLV